MSTKPAILFYCQHALGMGHLVRSMALAGGLSEAFRVVFLNGGPLPKSLKLPAGIDIINLPPLGFDSNNQLVSRDRRRTAQRACELRRKLIIETLQTLRPQIVLIELFPFGRKKFTSELLPLLDEVTKLGCRRPLVVCSLRDILVGKRRDQEKHDARALAVANQYFDAILVHSDPAFARFEETFQLSSKLETPVFYTGYVAPKRKVTTDSKVTKRKQIVVSAGGGLVGHSLLQTAIEAFALLPGERLEMRIIAGPFLPEASWQALRAVAKAQSGLRLVRSVPDLCEAMRSASLSVSQCGYNTALDILQSAVPALVIPFAEGSEDEQMQRASRLEELGAVRVLSHEQLSANRLASEIQALIDFKPKAPTLDLNGVQNSVRILKRLLQRRPSPAAHAHRTSSLRQEARL